MSSADSSLSDRPRISVVVPVYNGERTLAQTLRSLQESNRKPDEVIVVDDGSTDRSVEIARSFGVTILSTHGRQGPATARSLGAEEATGEILLFLDSDVAVHPGTESLPGTVERIGRVFEEQASVAAVFGSYDTEPPEPNFVSQWKNLTHHFVHHRGHSAAQTFWSGCGAIRKTVFDDAGGFDLSFRGATIEDIELGYRLRKRGHRILLDPKILCTHAKRWTAWTAWKTDLFYRGIPWTRLILRTGIVPDDLNVSVGQRFSTVFAWMMVLAFAYAALALPVASLAGMVLFVLLLTQAWWMEPPSHGPKVLRWLVPLGMFGTAIATSVYFGLLLFSICLMMGLALAFLFRRRPSNVRSRAEDVCYALYFGFGLLALVADLPPDRSILLASILALLLLGLNQNYYAYLAHHRGVAFMMAVLPFQFVYHFMNGVSLIAGTALTLRESPGLVFRRHGSTAANADHVPSPRTEA